MKKNEKAVTLVSLVITIIVLLIISGISVYGGKEVIQKAKLEELRTNMLLIQAKAREYVEEANFKIGFETDETEISNTRNEVYVEEALLEKLMTAPVGVNKNENIYKVTENALEKWGLEKIDLSTDGDYVIYFNDNEVKVEIYNTNGYKDNGIMKYSLTDIEAIE